MFHQPRLGCTHEGAVLPVRQSNDLQTPGRSGHQLVKFTGQAFLGENRHEGTDKHSQWIPHGFIYIA